MASLTGNLVAETYKALLKTIDNDILTASEKQITDGLGGGSNVFIDSNGFLRANKYKVTNGLATQFLKADGSLDANAYLTSITGAQVITALGFTPVTNARTLTINGTTYDLTANRSWTIAGTSAIWGNITGTLSNQTDLQNALNAKFNNPTGTVSQYIRGDGTLATFPTLPGGLPTGGTAGQILSKIDSVDYNAHWIDNFATQTKNEVKLGQTIAKGKAVYVSSANGTNIIVSAASNTSEALSSKTFGLLETGGVTNDLVKCVTFGLLAGLDTSTAQAGDPVWLGVNGALIFGLANKPYAPAHLVYIGVVTRVQQNNGEIFVNVQNGFELKEIHDVYIADPANNNGLFYDLADGLWKNKSIASVLGYTPQAQLNGTGFVKASGTTITYDNSTYLTTSAAALAYQPLDGDLTAIAALAGTSGFLKKTAADTWVLDTNTYLTTASAASTYQRLDNLSTDLTASASKYPSVNAVNAGLATKLNLTGGTLTGDLGFNTTNTGIGWSMNTDGASIKFYNTGDGDTNSRLEFATIDNNDEYFRWVHIPSGGTLYEAMKLLPISNGNSELIVNGKIKIAGGTSSQFLKADGSFDTNIYLTTSVAASTYQRLDKMVSNLLASATEYPNSNAVIAALALKANAANPVFTGNMTISGAEPKLFFTDTDNNPDYTIFIDSGIFYIYDQTNGATRFSIGTTGNISAGVGKSITADSFIKDGGTASQFLKADGSIDSSTYVTSGTLANYLLISTAASTYQTLANLSADLTASTTKYPSVNAVVAGLDLRQPLDGDLTAIAALTGTSGFLKKSAANTWLLDTNTYLTTADASTTYLTQTTAASTYQRLDKMVSNLLASSTEYPNSNAVIAALALKANAANPVFTGDFTISGTTPRLYFVDTDQNPDYTVFIDSGFFYIYDQTAGATRFQINSSGNISTGIGKSITAGSIIRDGGTSSQYLMADGSVSTFGGVTGSGTLNRIPKFSGTTSIGNSIIYDQGDKISIGSSNDTRGVLTSNGQFLSYYSAEGNPRVEINRDLLGGGLSGIGFTDRDGSFATWGVAVGLSAQRELGFFVSNGTALTKYASINSSGVFFVNSSAVYAKIQIGYNFYIDNDQNPEITSFVNSSGTSIFRWLQGSTPSERMRLSANGNLLVGNTSDAGFKLDVNGTGRFAGTVSNLNNLIYSGGSLFLRNPANTFDWALYQDSGNNLKFDFNGSNRFLMGSGGATTFSSSVTATIFDSTLNAFRFSGSNALSLVSLGGQSVVKINAAGYWGTQLVGANDQGILIDNTGKVGIGTTAPSERLEVTGIIYSARTTYGGPNDAGGYRLKLQDYGGINNDAGIGIESSGGPMWFNNASNSGGFYWNDGTNGERMRLNSGGNLLIGTTTDSGDRLNVNGSIRIPSAFFFRYNGDVGLIGSGSSIGGGSVSQLGIRAASDILFATNGATERMRINSNGNIGIGTTSPESRLMINGDWADMTGTITYSTNTKGIILNQDAGGGQGMGIWFRQAGLTAGIGSTRVSAGDWATDLRFYTHPSSTTNQNTLFERMRINSEGNVGIGTTAPGQLLTLSSSNTQGTAINLINTSSGGYSWNIFSGGSDANLGTVGSLIFRDSNNGITRMVINSSGNVGIGTTSPIEKLHVNGNIYIESRDVYGASSYSDAAVNKGMSFSGTNLLFNNNGEKVRITNNGAVGILTNNPTNTLHVYDGGSNRFILRLQAETGNTANLYTGIGFSGESANTKGGIFFQSYGSSYARGKMIFALNNSQDQSNATPSNAILTLEASGTATFVSSVTATSFFESSDFRLKTLIEHNPIIEGIEKLQAKLYEKNGKLELGYFAQDAEKLMPYAVTKNADGFLNLSYREVHTAKIARLEKEVAELKAQLNLN